MPLIIAIFMIVSTIFAVIATVCVVSDWLSERAVQPVEVAPIPEPIPEPEPEPEPEPIPEPEPEPEPELEIIESAPVIVPVDLPEPEDVEEGVEIIEVAWPESMAKNKIYRYDPNGVVVARGDTVLVPTFDKPRRREVLRTATVINGNYHTTALPEGLVLKKVVRVVKQDCSAAQ